MLTEIREELRLLDDGPGALRKFGLAVGAVFALIALFILWRRGWEPGTAVLVVGAVAAVLILFGAAAPRALTAVYRAWMGMALVLGFLMTRVILTIVFVGMVVPIGLLLRLFGKDLLALRRAAPDDSYWKLRDEEQPTAERLKRLY